MTKIKIGQEMEFKERCCVRTMLGIDSNMTIEIGDRAVATKFGLKLLTGEAKDRIIQPSHFDIEIVSKKYDYANIAKLIFKNMKINTEIEEAMEDYDISDKEIREVIEDTLREII